MRAIKVILRILLISFCFAVTSNAASETECATIEYIEALNNGALERVAHIKGENAIVFMALDPSWSEPEFEYDGYRDEHFIAAIKGMRKPLMKMGVDVQLPRVTSSPELAGERLIVTVDADHKIYLNGEEIAAPHFERVLHNALLLKTDRVAFMADESVSYGYVARVLDWMRRAGATDVGLVTVPVEKEPEE